MSLSHHPSIPRNGLVFCSDPANYKSYPAAQDPYVNSISLMLDGESLIDKSLNNLTVTNNGATISSSQFKFGNSSLSFNGSSSYLSLSSTTPFTFGTGDFTIEFWVYFNSSSGIQVIYDSRPITSGGLFPTIYYTGGTIRYYQSQVDQITSSSISLSTWYHVAVVRSSGITKMYLNGVQTGSSYTDSNNYSCGSNRPWIGSDSYNGGLAPSNYFNGYIDDFRITKGYARYTSNFTPPQSALPLPNVSIDLTKNKYNVTYSSGTTFSSSNGGTISLNGTNGYGSGVNFLTVGPTSSFTVCTWVKYNSTVTSGPARCSAVAKSVNTNDFEAILGFPYTYSSSKLGLEVGKAGVQSQTAYAINSNPTGVWYHLCGVFMNGSGNFYINGIYQSTVTYNSTINSASSNANAWTFGTEPFNGSASGPFVNGNLGPTQVYNRTLSANEIFQNYTALKGRFGL